MVERTRGTAGAAFRPWRWWPEWIGHAPAAWSLIYGALGLYWALGGAGFPFGSENDPQSALSVLGGVQEGTGAKPARRRRAARSGGRPVSSYAEPQRATLWSSVIRGRIATACPPLNL